MTTGDCIMSGYVTGVPKILLRLEGLVVLAIATAGYFVQHGSWWLFVLLMLAPDLSILGYLLGKKAGAALYNAAHWYALPLVLLAWGAIGQEPQALMIGLVWAGHIGMDRAIGAGLKYADGFGFTHLGQHGARTKAK
jgi:Domain of unknown function (DUF4260)